MVQLARSAAVAGFINTQLEILELSGIVSASSQAPLYLDTAKVVAHAQTVERNRALMRNLIKFFPWGGSGIPYYQVFYEDLIGRQRAAHISALFAFLDIKKSHQGLSTVTGKITHAQRACNQKVSNWAQVKGTLADAGPGLVSGIACAVERPM